MWFVSGQPVTHTTGLSGKSPADFPRPQLATCPMGLHVQADDEFHKSSSLFGSGKPGVWK